MIKKFVSIVLAFILFAGLVISPVLAQEEKQGRKVGDKIALPSGDEAVFLGMSGRQEIWQATIGDPKYVKGTNTPYDSQWHLNILDGSYVAGANDFTANVSSKSVSITYQSKTQRWTPDTKLDAVKAVEKSAIPELLAVDPINSNYLNNTLMWDYNNGVKRYLRIIEGMLIEYYKIERPLNKDFTVEANLISDAGYAWNRPAVAWDANNEPIDLTSLGNHNYAFTKDKVKTKTNKDIVYPITIDPDSTFYTSASDGYLSESNAVWATVRADTSASSGWTSGILLYSVASSFGGAFLIEKSALYFDTSILPDSANITNASLYLYAYSKIDGDNAKVYIANGMPTYPHDPLVGADYNLTNYGSYALTYGNADVGSDITLNQYNKINVSDNASLATIVNRTGATKLMLIERHDYANEAPVPPTEYNDFRAYAYEQGSGFRPYLVVTYVIETPTITADAASDVAVTSARLNATVDFDGYESSQVRFGYGNVTQTAGNFTNYTVTTNWSAAVWDTGEHPYYDASSLNASTTYYYRAQIMNSSGNSTSTNEISFTTPSSVGAPTNFRAYPSTTSVSLSWTPGGNSSQTQVVYSATTFPTSNTTGTIVYTGTSSTTPHSNLSAGHTYYYSAWGESGGSWSSSYATVVVTTSAFSVEGDDLETPSVWAEWFQAPDYTNLANLEPLYSAVNGMADSFGTPRNNAWQGLVLILIAVASIGLMMKAGWMAGVVVGSMMMLGGIAIHILPAWMMLLIIVFALFGWAINQRGVGTQ